MLPLPTLILFLLGGLALSDEPPLRAGTDWWSLQPVRLPAVPQIRDRNRVRNPIDMFVLQRLAERGLTLAHETDKLTYIRRAKFDLLGLPPAPDEIDEFLTDDSPDSYEKLVDRLLASPHYGQRWGRHWLDVVRFGESDGFENDKLREHAWRYRDYVIQSFNEDKPYDLFVQEQLAGDVLSPVTRDGIIASGFLVAGPWDEVQNVAKSPTERKRAHEEQMEELLGTVSQTFLGLTVNCARCHDHKFDPIPQTDYYRLKAVFDGVDHGNRPILTPDEQAIRDALLAPLQARIKELKTSLDELANKAGGDAIAQVGDAKSLLVEGRFGKALNARNTQVETKSRPVFHTPPLTVECWAKVESKSGFNILVANNLKESSEHWEIYTYAGSGEFSAYLPGFEPAEIKSGVDVTDGTWHHVAMQFDGTHVQLFVDAKIAKDIAVIRKQSGGALSSLSFGSYPPQNIGCDGSVDEVRVSNVLREIGSIPKSPFVADEHTIGLWHFDSADGQRLEDSSSSTKSDDREELKKQEAVIVAELKKKESELAAHPEPLTYSGLRRQPEPTFVLLRGDISKPGPQVTAGSVSAIRNAALDRDRVARPESAKGAEQSPTEPATPFEDSGRATRGSAVSTRVVAMEPDLNLPADTPEAQRRLRFAKWVASPSNPLTARVMVNRIWQYHFGSGLINTPSDLGFNGGQPTHPELLDWLASEFVAPISSDQQSANRNQQLPPWSLKRLHKLILLSATYRQSSAFNPAAAEMDADNRLLWRFAPRRLEAETVRDAMLSVSGELNPQIGGPSFRPFTVTSLLTQFYHLIDDDRPDFNRRTIYRINVNTAKSPLLDSLDCPAPSITAPKRRNTTTTLQALSLMNDSFVIRQADRFAERVRRTVGDDLHAQISLAYQLAFGRTPTGDELAVTGNLAREHGLEAVSWALLNTSEFLHVR